jgi:hypothetical protein
VAFKLKSHKIASANNAEHVQGVYKSYGKLTVEYSVECNIGVVPGKNRCAAKLFIWFSTIIFTGFDT